MKKEKFKVFKINNITAEQLEFTLNEFGENGRGLINSTNTSYVQVK